MLETDRENCGEGSDHFALRVLLGVFRPLHEDGGVVIVPIIRSGRAKPRSYFLYDHDIN